MGLEHERGRRVVVVGQGYVGLPLAIRAAEQGFDVVGLDLDADRIARLRAARSFTADVDRERLASVLASGRYRPTTDSSLCEGFDVAVITVPTPLREGAPDLTAVEDAAGTLARYLTAGALVVLESTTYPGTTEELLVPTLEAGSGLHAGDDFYVGFSPERIDPGNPTWDLVTTPKLVAGIDGPSLKVIEDFYGRLVEVTVPLASTREAELAKLLENTFRHVNIALVNELAMFAHELDIDIWNVIDAASTKPFGFMRFHPGAGVGGHCLPIDPSYLSWQVKRSLGHDFRFVELANDINEHMPDYVVNRLTHVLNLQRKSVNGSRILILGIAYKPNSADARESPATDVADRLIRLGASVRCCDPHVGPEATPRGAARVELTADEVRQADVVLLLSDHDDFDYDMVAKTAAYVFDARHRMTGANVEHL